MPNCFLSFSQFFFFCWMIFIVYHFSFNYTDDHLIFDLYTWIFRHWILFIVFVMMYESENLLRLLLWLDLCLNKQFLRQISLFSTATSVLCHQFYGDNVIYAFLMFFFRRRIDMITFFYILRQMNVIEAENLIETELKPVIHIVTHCLNHCSVVQLLV